MKVFAMLVLSLYISCGQTEKLAKKSSACLLYCASNYRPVCGYNGQCHQEAINKCVMHNFNCKRREVNQVTFFKVRPGQCPASNKCPEGTMDILLDK